VAGEGGNGSGSWRLRLRGCACAAHGGSLSSGPLSLSHLVREPLREELHHLDVDVGPLLDHAATDPEDDHVVLGEAVLGAEGLVALAWVELLAVDAPPPDFQDVADLLRLEPLANHLPPHELARDVRDADGLVEGPEVNEHERSDEGPDESPVEGVVMYIAVPGGDERDLVLTGPLPCGVAREVGDGDVHHVGAEGGELLLHVLPEAEADLVVGLADAAAEDGDALDVLGSWLFHASRGRGREEEDLPSPHLDVPDDLPQRDRHAVDNVERRRGDDDAESARRDGVPPRAFLLAEDIQLDIRQPVALSG